MKRTETPIAWQQLQGLCRTGDSSLDGESLKLGPVPLPTQYPSGGFCLQEDTWKKVAVAVVGGVDEYMCDQPPEHDSYRRQITKICIFVGFTGEGSMWDLCKSPSPDVLTTLAWWGLDLCHAEKLRVQ